MKFGKQIQRQQLDLPEYAASFLDYKALKKLIKQLSATPTIPAQNAPTPSDTKAALRANKEVFFFRLEREIEKVNVFYVQKEEEFSLRLKTLLDRKRVIQARIASNPRHATTFVSLVEGFQQFDNDLNKLQQFVEINEIAISKILKKWDKTSKSRTKELYLQRAVDIQPCFNRDVLEDLSDRATTARLELEAWAEGENVQYEAPRPIAGTIGHRVGTEESDTDLQILQAAISGNISSLREWLNKLGSSSNGGERFTRIFLASISDSPDESLGLLLSSNIIDIHAEDDVNERNCLHEAAIYGKELVLDHALQHGLDLARVDAYGRTALHYACLKGRVSMTRKLVEAGPATVDLKDHDNFTPLIHSITRNRTACVQLLLSHNAQIDPASGADHVPLNLACQHQSTEVATLLLEKRAMLLPDAEGLYPQHLVARSSHTPELLLLLKEHGADLNQRDKLYQWTPLFHAASEGRVECLRTLLLNGADPDALDEKGLTAMYYATWEGNIECMELLWRNSSHGRVGKSTSRSTESVVPAHHPSSSPMDATSAQPGEVDGIPDLSLPPPIIPLRRYGHNFLDKKTLISINFNRGAESIKFFNEGRYPAARLTISSKVSDLIPRNIMLPIQEDSKALSFQVEDLNTFALDLEIFPTFGSKVIAKSVALPDVFRATLSSSGSCCLPLFDPRLRAIGQIQFSFQVIKPYNGIPLEISQFSTYWKSTSALDDRSGLVTGSSLSGNYLQLVVQFTRDAVPVLYPAFKYDRGGIEVPVGHIDYLSITRLGLQGWTRQSLDQISLADDLVQCHAILSPSLAALRDVLDTLPVSVSVNLQVLYPSASEEEKCALAPTININHAIDAILEVVFDHARAVREQHSETSRSIMFSSTNAQICAALNWKQPNYPVLLSSILGELGSGPVSNGQGTKACLSIKESARLARSNNLMGLVCQSNILEMVPALIETIKEAGVLLVADTSRTELELESKNTIWDGFPDGIDGVMKSKGVVRFIKTPDV